jgi:hypothetical protein
MSEQRGESDGKSLSESDEEREQRMPTPGGLRAMV